MPDTVIRVCDKGFAETPPITVDSSIGVIGGGYCQELMSWSEEYQGVPSYSTRQTCMERISIASESDAYYFGELATDNHNQSGDDDNNHTGIFGGSGEGTEVFDINTDGSSVFWGWLTVERNDLGCAANNIYAVFSGGWRAETVVDYFTWASQSDAAVWGNHYIDRAEPAGTADTGNVTGLFGGGWMDDSLSNIEQLQFASQANLTNFGELDIPLDYPAAVSDDVQALFGGGYIDNDPPSPKYMDIGITNWVHTVLYASGGQVSEFGTLSIHRAGIGTVHDSTVALWCGGADFAAIGFIDKQYFASGGQYTAFGSLIGFRAYAGTASGGTMTVDDAFPIPDPPSVPNPEVGDTALLCGGRYPYYGYQSGFFNDIISGDIEQYSYKSQGLANDFGELLAHSEDHRGASNNTIALWVGGYVGTNDGEYYTSTQKSDIRSAGNSTFWGNMSTPVADNHAVAGNSEKIVVMGGRTQPDRITTDVIQEYATATEADSTHFGNLSESHSGSSCAANEEFILLAGMRYGASYGYYIGRISFVTGSTDTNWSETGERYNQTGCSDYDDTALWGYYDPPDGIAWYKYLTKKSSFASGYNAFNWSAQNDSSVLEDSQACSNSQEALFISGYGYYGSYGPQCYIISHDFASSVDVSWVGNVKRQVSSHAVASDHAPGKISCDINNVFNVYSYFNLENLDFQSYGSYINMFEPFTNDVQIEMINCETNASLDNSMTNTRKLLISNSTFTITKPIEYSFIKNLYISNVNISANDLSDIETHICKIDNSDVYKLETYITFDKQLDFNDINGVVINKSFVKSLNVTLETT